MKLNNWINQWDISSLKLNVKFLEVELNFKDADRKAAWELYIELLTRVATQYLDPKDGDEATALESIHKIFELTRTTIKNNGRECIQFTKIAIPILNQVIRPFTTKWHRLYLKNVFMEKEKCEEFRKELRILQENIRKYTKLLACMAEVEDLTIFED